eukprot:CAMPEP_0115240672 /NCGR_PEP_ID=MMETSP0270-20121206/38032_1 /TAXON_ID=71861 /ORGANISM="Scrippsiella trochoidea, Strain CCMP3099" /LENGTH=30 /DNA_ID= /DNA_START= /DNA_END= /DNA_ORIENTATION=
MAAIKPGEAKTAGISAICAICSEGPMRLTV